MREHRVGYASLAPEEAALDQKQGSAAGGTTRRYVPSVEKHKRPKGFGSLCPPEMATEEAQALLDRAVSSPDTAGSALWVVSGDWCFVARPTRLEESVWHGYPQLGSEIREHILGKLEAAGMIDRRQKRRLRKQKQLPKKWPWP